MPVALAGQATLTSPTPGSTLAGSNATFTWAAGTGTTQYDLWLGLSGPGSSSVYASGWSTATSTTVPSLPGKGATVYARLYSNGSAGQQYIDYVFTEPTDTPATLVSPAPGSALGASNTTFTWTAGTGETQYQLWLGLGSPGSSSVYTSGWLTTTSATVPSVPATGATIYARLYWKGSAGLHYSDYIYSEAGGALLSAFSCTNASMTGSGTDTCTVTLNAAAPSGGMTVSLSSSGAAATVPATVLVPANATSVGFMTTVSSVSTAQPMTLTAVGGGVSQTFALQLNASTPTLSVATSASPSNYGGAVTFTATISSGPTGSVTFYNGGVSIGTGTISGTTATVASSSLTAGSHSVTAGWLGNSSYGAVTSSAITQAVNKATPVLSWNTPAVLTYGTALSASQLDATSNVAGTLAYSPAAGTVLAAGAQTLTVTFTPTDTTDYKSATTTVALGVNKGTPTITWATPAAVTYGTALSASQLDATSNVAGTLAYSPAAGTVLAAGAETLTVIFTPTDSVDYNAASVSVTLTVYQGVATLTVNATSMGFGNVVLNQPATQTLTLSSTGTSSVTVNSAVLAGTGFTSSGPAFPVTLAAGQTTTIGVQFDPTVAGAASGTLTISSTSSSNGTATITLSGTGTTGSYAVNLSWDAPVSSTDPVAGYNIYRSPVGSTTYQLLNSSVESQTAYVDNNVQVGTSYDYIVESVDASGVESVPTSPVAVTIP